MGVTTPTGGGQDRSPYVTVTTRPTAHPIVGSPDAPEEPPCGSRWELWEVVWDSWQSDKGCSYRCLAIWKCPTSGVVRTTVQTKTVPGDCQTFI